MGGGEGYSHYNIFTHIHKQVDNIYTNTEIFYDLRRKDTCMISDINHSKSCLKL